MTAAHESIETSLCMVPRSSLVFLEVKNIPASFYPIKSFCATKEQKAGFALYDEPPPTFIVSAERFLGHIGRADQITQG